MVTELQLLQRRAKYLGINATGKREELLKRIARAEGITRAEVLEIIKRDLAKRKAQGAKGAKAKQKLSVEQELIMTYCGSECFAGGKAICPPCDRTQCHCTPTCSLVRAAYNRGDDVERMKAYANALGCPIVVANPRAAVAAAVAKRAGHRFIVGDIIVGYDVDGPVFAIVDEVDSPYTQQILVTELKQIDSELMKVFAAARAENYKFTAEEILDFDDRFAVEPAPKELKQFAVNPKYFELYDENKQYYKTYTLKDIKKLL